MHSYVSCLVHCVFVTRKRRPFIKPDLQQRLWAYLGGIARENKMKALRIGGVEDHVHLLISLPATLSVSRAVQLLKGNSSKWIHTEFPQYKDFEWQEGYGAFRIGVRFHESQIGVKQGKALDGEAFREVFTQGMAQPSDELHGALGGPSDG